MGMKRHDISGEHSRTYRVILPMVGMVYERTIKNPLFLFYEKGHQFHRIWNGNIMLLLPAPGLIEIEGRTGFVEVAWTPKDPENPCKF